MNKRISLILAAAMTVSCIGLGACSKPGTTARQSAADQTQESESAVAAEPAKQSEVPASESEAQASGSEAGEIGESGNAGEEEAGDDNMEGEGYELKDTYDRLLCNLYSYVKITNEAQAPEISFFGSGVDEVLVYGGNESDKLDLISYAYHDVDKNGDPELLITDAEGNILCIFVIGKGGIPSLEDIGWLRNRCWIDSDGNVYHMGSSGASYTDARKYKMNGNTEDSRMDRITLSEQVYSDVEDGNEFWQSYKDGVEREANGKKNAEAEINSDDAMKTIEAWEKNKITLETRKLKEFVSIMGDAMDGNLHSGDLARMDEEDGLDIPADKSVLGSSKEMKVTYRLINGDAIKSGKYTYEVNRDSKTVYSSPESDAFTSGGKIDITVNADDVGGSGYYTITVFGGTGEAIAQASFDVK